MTAAFRHHDAVFKVGDDWIERLIEHAHREPLRRSRLCLHHSEADAVQEMLIAFCRDTLIPPHRHPGKTESFHLIHGALTVLIFDEEGHAIEQIPMGIPGSGRSFAYRLSQPLWHSVIVESEVALVHEVSTGPFQRDDSPPPAWMPAGEIALRAFIDSLRHTVT